MSIVSLGANDRGELVSLAKRVALVGGEQALHYFRNKNLDIKNKDVDRFDPVTEADSMAEEAMRNLISKIRPSDSIFGEEMGVTEGESAFTWILDPIDGTRAFLSGAPVWTVLVSVSDGKTPFLGVINQPFTKEVFTGGLGVSELTQNGFAVETCTRQCDGLSNAILFTTFPEIGTELERRAFNTVSDKVKLTRYGMDAYAFALLAMGQIDIVIEAGLKSYDVSAPIAVIEAAGGIVTDWAGGSASVGGQVLACGDRHIHTEILKILSNFL